MMEPKRNYQIEMEKELVRLHKAGERPLLALHSCCAPCSSAVLERLNEAFRIVVYYYNPNISPEAEFIHRAEEQMRLATEMPLREVSVVQGEYDPNAFFERVRGHENDPEGGERCGICFEMRLRQTAEFARQIGAPYFTTTLSISPLKDDKRLNAIGEALAEEYVRPKKPLPSSAISFQKKKKIKLRLQKKLLKKRLRVKTLMLSRLARKNFRKKFLQSAKRFTKQRQKHRQLQAAILLTLTLNPKTTFTKQTLLTLMKINN